MSELQKVEEEFMTWLDNVNYSAVEAGLMADSIYYRLIEGVRNGEYYNASFDAKRGSNEPLITIRARFPRGEQRFTINQFREWMSAPNRTSFLQQF